MSQQPGLFLERGLWARGYRRVAGLDEAGRGSWAGPVVAAFVVFASDAPELSDHLEGVRDSKLLTPNARDLLYTLIIESAASYGVGTVPAVEIDRIGIVPATRMAMRLALLAADPPPDYLLIDSLLLPEVPIAQYCMPKGDRYCLSVAAASILAKVSRDRWMIGLDKHYPGYGLAQHKGYGTRQHLAALRAMGATDEHRRSFRPVRETIERQQLSAASIERNHGES